LHFGTFFPFWFDVPIKSGSPGLKSISVELPRLKANDGDEHLSLAVVVAFVVAFVVAGIVYVI
jgi:hypothetical protein